MSNKTANETANETTTEPANEPVIPESSAPEVQAFDKVLYIVSAGEENYVRETHHDKPKSVGTSYAILKDLRSKDVAFKGKPDVLTVHCLIDLHVDWSDFRATTTHICSILQYHLRTWVDSAYKLDPELGTSIDLQTLVDRLGTLQPDRHGVERVAIAVTYNEKLQEFVDKTVLAQQIQQPHELSLQLYKGDCVRVAYKNNLVNLTKIEPIYPE